MKTADVAIVGGGIVGLATADALRLAGVSRVVVLEGADRVGSQQTGHNSGVIHSGLYYRPGSLKAVLCAKGRDAMYAFCEEENVPFRRSGKLVVATTEPQVDALTALEERGRANGLTGVSRLDAAQIRALDPEVSGLAGLWIAETGVVDFAAVARALGGRVSRGGGEVKTGSRVTQIEDSGGTVRIRTTTGEVEARAMVNCAGLQSDRVAWMAGVDPGAIIVPFRGEYYQLRPERDGLVKNLVYPVPDPALPFLGVHFTRRIDGRVEAGPNAVLALNRDGFARWSAARRDVAAMVTHPGFWRMARRLWRTGVGEIARSVSKPLFVRALQRLVPGLRSEDLGPGGCGVRAQAVDRAGKLIDDFHIVASERGVHVINAPSPAATASLAIGAHVAGLTLELLGG